MAGNNAKRCFAALGTMALVLVAMAVIYVVAVLLASPKDKARDSFVVQEDTGALAPMQAASGSDAAQMARLFGAPLPVLRGYPSACDGRNTTHDGQTARLVTLTYPGVVISAVRPSSAAPLLLRPGLSLQLRSDLTALNLPAALASRGREHCLYFSDEHAAYAIYAPNCTEEEFLQMLALVGQEK